MLASQISCPLEPDKHRKIRANQWHRLYRTGLALTRAASPTGHRLAAKHAPGIYEQSLRGACQAGLEAWCVFEAQAFVISYPNRESQREHQTGIETIVQKGIHAVFCRVSAPRLEKQ